MRIAFPLAARTMCAARTMLAAAAVCLLGACEVAEKATASHTLPPVRNLTGTWKTTFPITFHYQTDFCTGNETVAAADWNVTWVITPVLHGLRATRLSAIPAGNAQQHLHLDQQARRRADLQRLVHDRPDGGTWVHWECIIYCTGEFTGTNHLKMMRQ